MPETSLQTKRVADWLESCGELPPMEEPKSLSFVPAPEPIRPITLQSCLKRPRLSMDGDGDTPRAKRQAHGLGLATPSASSRRESDMNAIISDYEKTPSFRSSSTTGTNRSPSPSKRQREAEIEFSTPAFTFHTRSDSKRWREGNAGGVPHMIDLVESINIDAQGVAYQVPRVTVVQILKEVEKCKDRDATEEAWSDAVIYPVLRLARSLFQEEGEERIDIINVKSVDVFPLGLLPTNMQGLLIGKKRVDYTIGLEIGHRDRVDSLRQTADNYTLTQSNHKMLRDRALCAHLEIKAENSLDDGGRFQLSTWCAAGFQKQENLWLQRYPHAQRSVMPRLAPVPLLLWKGTIVQVWVAVMDSEHTVVHMLDERKLVIDEEDVESLSKVVRMIAAVMEWGSKCYAPWLRAHIGYQEERQLVPESRNDES